MNKKLRFYLPCDQSMCYLKALHMKGSLTHTQKALTLRGVISRSNNNVDNRINIHSIYRQAKKGKNSIKRISTYDVRRLGHEKIETDTEVKPTLCSPHRKGKKNLLWTLIHVGQQLIM